MTHEEYMDKRELLLKQLNRCKNDEDRARLRAKIEKLDDSFKTDFYGHLAMTSRPEQKLQQYGVV